MPVTSGASRQRFTSVFCLMYCACVHAFGVHALFSKRSNGDVVCNVSHVIVRPDSLSEPQCVCGILLTSVPSRRWSSREVSLPMPRYFYTSTAFSLYEGTQMLSLGLLCCEKKYSLVLSKMGDSQSFISLISVFYSVKEEAIWHDF